MKASGSAERSKEGRSLGRLLAYSSDASDTAGGGHSLAIRDRRSLADAVYGTVRELILSGEIEDGGRIGIDQAARSFDVSATPVREALARLESDGLVQRVAHRGYIVSATWDSKSFDQMHEVRMLIEPYAARLTAKKVKEGLLAPGITDGLEDDLEKMTTLLNDMDPESSQLDIYRKFAKYDKQFHERIVDALENPALSEIIQRARPHPRVVHLYVSSGVASISIDEHRAILDGIREGAAKVAEKAMKAHLLRTCQRLRPWTVITD